MEQLVISFEAGSVPDAFALCACLADAELRAHTICIWDDECRSTNEVQEHK